MRNKTLWLVGLLCILTIGVLIKGCDQDQQAQAPSAPGTAQPVKIILNIAKNSNPQAKATKLTIDITGIDDYDRPTGRKIDSIVIPGPDFPQLTFPLNIPVTLYKPPCRYRFTVKTELSRDPERIKDTIADICGGTSGKLTINTFEPFTIADLTIQAPGSAPAGAPIEVSCSASRISAPDSGKYPLSMRLEERNGDVANDPAPYVSGIFPDPSGSGDPSVGTRIFTCTIGDGRSPSQWVEWVVTRVFPTPTPTAAPIPTATPTPPRPIVMYNIGQYDGDLASAAVVAGGVGIGNGRQGADYLCNLNIPAGYTNARAFLSIDLLDRVREMTTNYGVPANVPIVGPGGTQIVANWAELWDGSIDTNLVTAGVLPPWGPPLFIVPEWWSGSTPGGFESNNCNGWIVTIWNGVVGDGYGADAFWINNGTTPPCAQLRYVVCIAY